MLDGFLPEQQRLTVWGLCRACQDGKTDVEE
jgi:hypothetical protein